MECHDDDNLNDIITTKTTQWKAISNIRERTWSSQTLLTNMKSQKREKWNEIIISFFIAYKINSWCLQNIFKYILICFPPVHVPSHPSADNWIMWYDVTNCTPSAYQREWEGGTWAVPPQHSGPRRCSSWVLTEKQWITGAFYYFQIPRWILGSW